jgi:hypothetical protein
MTVLCKLRLFPLFVPLFHYSIYYQSVVEFPRRYINLLKNLLYYYILSQEKSRIYLEDSTLELRLKE